MTSNFAGRDEIEMPPDLAKRMKQAAVARVVRVILIIFGASTLAGQMLEPVSERAAAIGWVVILIFVYAISHGEDDARAAAIKYQPGFHPWQE